MASPKPSESSRRAHPPLRDHLVAGVIALANILTIGAVLYMLAP